MDGMYGFHSTSGYVNTPENELILPPENQSASVVVDQSSYWPYYGSDDLLSVAASVISDAVSIQTTAITDDVFLRRRSNRPCDRARNGGLEVGDGDDEGSGDTIKERIASHPSYSKLLAAYIDCRKVGAPPEIACLLDDILLENDARRRSVTASTCLGIDPELDDFMETYFHVLVKYKSDLARPFDEAAVFLGNIETQLRNLCKDEGGNVSSEEEFSGGETDNTQISQELKHTLLRKFGGRIGSLKQEFTKKKKKGKLPKEARQKLLEWWNSHNKWPYPTEGDKISLAETTGLDPKQINNWFINQRKRHWKPSESMQLAVMGALPGQHLYDD